MKTFAGVKDTKLILQTKAFDVREQIIIYSDNTSSRHITAVHRGAVVMLPQMDNNHFLLLKQYRHSIGKTLLEFPAGTLAEDEDPLVAAKRELIEEVNHRADEWVELGVQYPAPGFCNELQHCYLARGLHSEQGTLDEDEIIEVVALSRADIEAAIIDGTLTDAKSIGIYTKARLRGVI